MSSPARAEAAQQPEETTTFMVAKVVFEGTGYQAPVIIVRVAYGIKTYYPGQVGIKKANHRHRTVIFCTDEGMD